MQTSSQDPSQQPILPAFSTRWLFLAMTVIAVVISVYMQNTIDRTLLLVLALLVAIACLFLFLSALCFVVCSLFGTLTEILDQSKQRPQSPFAGDRLPPQIVPRKE